MNASGPLVEMPRAAKLAGGVHALAGAASECMPGNMPLHAGGDATPAKGCASRGTRRRTAR